MSGSSSMLLVGVGGSGSKIAMEIARRHDSAQMRLLLADTDAASAQPAADFLLLGGDRLAGDGAGGDIVSARLAAEDALRDLDERLGGVRLAVLVAGLGGGTGSGATLEIAKHLSRRGIASVVFATTPFSFEGEARHRNARGVISLISEATGAAFFMPLDKLVQNEENMDGAMEKAFAEVSSAISMFWWLLEKPGYIAFDAERLRKLLANPGRGRFAVAECRGADRARRIVAELASSALLAEGSAGVRSILCGVLAGEDLRLAEIASIAEGVRKSFGERAAFELATVNDEEAFGSRICVVTMLFEASAKEDAPAKKTASGKRRQNRMAILSQEQSSGRFASAGPTIWHGEDVDTPTYLRQHISLEF